MYRGSCRRVSTNVTAAAAVAVAGAVASVCHCNIDLIALCELEEAVYAELVGVCRKRT